MAYNSLLGYAKDGVAEVVASSKSAMSVIDHWALDAYRNLKFYSPTTGELKTWLEANAVKMPLTGTWVFKSTPTKCPGDFNINFNSNGGSFTGIYYSGEVSKSDPIRYIASPSGTYLTVYDNGAWEDQAYRTITFTEPVQYEGNEEFVRWFVDNAAPPQA